MSAAVEQSRRKKRSVVSPSCGLMSLPDDMVLNCFARVSRSDHGALSLVSKSTRSLVVSPELYETRSRMGFREDCIYVCLDDPLDRKPASWFILQQVKGKSLIKKNRLIPIPIPSFPTPYRAAFVPLGWGIYVIGGKIKGETTSRVSFLDCRTHTWSQVPSMSVARCAAMAGVLDGKIYVMGGCMDEEPSNCAEVFDPKMQTWSRVLISDPVMKEGYMVITWDSNLFKFQSEEGMRNDLKTRDDACCVLDKLVYCYDQHGKIMWCDPWAGVGKGWMEWYKVYGLEYLEGFLKYDFVNDKTKLIHLNGENADVWHCYMLKHGYPNGFEGLKPGVKLSKSGGDIFIFWGVLVEDDPKRLQVWCAEVSLERHQGGQVWGITQCLDHVFTIDPLLHVLSSVNVSI